jgi:hypothetical protein
MQTDWAVENLQVIRTLMERSAIYRRALAPMTLLAGTLGTVAAVLGPLLKVQAPRSFILYWLGLAALAIVGAAFLVRHQAVRAGEPFWSPPARRVARAALPAGVVALILTCGVLLVRPAAGFRDGSTPDDAVALAALPMAWVMLYGLGLNAAGFFMPRGIQLLGWIFVGGGGLSFLALAAGVRGVLTGHWLMGLHFGALHLAYGIYLLATEKNRPAL